MEITFQPLSFIHVSGDPVNAQMNMSCYMFTWSTLNSSHQCDLSINPMCFNHTETKDENKSCNGRVTVKRRWSSTYFESRFMSRIMNCTQLLVKSMCGCLLIRAPDILHRITRAWATVNPKDNVQSEPQSTGWIPSHPTDPIDKVYVPQ